MLYLYSGEAYEHVLIETDKGPNTVMDDISKVERVVYRAAARMYAREERDWQYWQKHVFPHIETKSILGRDEFLRLSGWGELRGSSSDWVRVLLGLSRRGYRLVGFVELPYYGDID